MLQNIKDEGKVAKLKHRTAWMRMERAKRVGQPWYGDSQAKGSGEAHDGLNGDSEAQIRPRVDRIPGYGTVGWAGQRQLRVRLAATCESYGEGDEFWTSGLMPK